MLSKLEINLTEIPEFDARQYIGQPGQDIRIPRQRGPLQSDRLTVRTSFTKTDLIKHTPGRIASHGIVLG